MQPKIHFTKHSMGRMNKIKAIAQSISIKLKQMLEVEAGSKRICFGLYE
jgi:hypothetical protein